MCDSYQDDYGNWVYEGGETLEFVGMCRYEADGKGTIYTTADGRSVTLSGVIYMMPIDFGTVDGAELSVKDSKGNELCRKKVINANYGRMNTKIWTY